MSETTKLHPVNTLVFIAYDSPIMEEGHEICRAYPETEDDYYDILNEFQSEYFNWQCVLRAEHQSTHQKIKQL